MTIFGSDVSHYDAANTRAMFADGIVFQTHKAGGDSNDAELAAWWGYVKDYRPKVLLGAYWVLYPGSPRVHADAFIARLDSQCPGWRDGPFILQADCERWNGNPATVPSVAEINIFCDRLVALMPKLKPIGYLPDWVYGDISAFRYPLWSSKYVTASGHYKTIYPGDDARQWASYGGKKPEVLQYSSRATIGGQTTCDANAYRGTLAQLTALLAPGWVKEEGIDVSTNDFITAFQDPEVQAAYNTMQAGAISKIKVYDYADGKNPHGQATWAEHMGHAPGTSGGRTEEKLDALTAKVDALTALLESHVAGLVEGQRSQPNG